MLRMGCIWKSGYREDLMTTFKKKTLGASLVAQTLKNLPTMQETWVQSLSQEDPLKEEMATHSSIVA